MSAVLVLPHGAPEGEWLERRREGIGASEIAAVMGISPWESPFSLWWMKREGWSTLENSEMSAGKRLEPVIADWWAETQAETGPASGWCVEPTGLWGNTSRPYQLATPDRLLVLEHSVLEGRSVLECKAAFSWDGWTEPDERGVGQIPVHYRAQVLWQIDTLELEYAWVAAFSGLSFRSYFIQRDEKDIRLMREYAERFMDSLERNIQPDVDEHSATLPILRRLNADIEDREQEIPAQVAEGWQRSRRFYDLAEKCKARYAAQVRHHLGSAKTATLAGRAFAFRTSNDQLRSKA